MDKKIDYSLILQAVSSYLVGAKDFFLGKKNNYSVGLIPDGHHIYTGTLKAAGYRLLKPNDTLVLVGESAIDNKLFVYSKNIKNFMGKDWNIDQEIEVKLKSYDFVEFTNKKFDRIDSELPFLNIISQYKNLVFIEIGENIEKNKLLNTLFDIYKKSNIIFISDFHKDKSMEECKSLDKKILNLNFVKKNKDLYLVNVFLSLANRLGKTPELLAYLNSGDISIDKKITNGFGTVLF
ncbi:MAG TPA: hypothetical protein VJ892_01250 [Candidatus Absconditabacterales bacterium]|nr:hypothetical protein [Candidatus Absconditabacterales bacterium]